MLQEHRPDRAVRITNACDYLRDVEPTLIEVHGFLGVVDCDGVSTKGNARSPYQVTESTPGDAKLSTQCWNFFSSQVARDEFFDRLGSEAPSQAAMRSRRLPRGGFLGLYLA